MMFGTTAATGELGFVVRVLEFFVTHNAGNHGPA